jgi:2-polyprenyl-3-methyl-5-hydroxy-6-metoxy-1,4-benzoquinol methylase
VKDIALKTLYEPAVGYSSLEMVDVEKLRRLVSVNRRLLDEYYSPDPGDYVLVAGAGRGDEAEAICQEYRLTTFGVDINIQGVAGDHRHIPLSFNRMDLENLAFAGGSFALVYCYHVLEHVSDYKRVLYELKRVMISGGVLFVGFPNKHRLFSYFGTTQSASIGEKIVWNLRDYRDRLRGRFENHLGAHAGFIEQEFLRDASAIYKEVHAVRNKYMQLKYARLSGMLQVVIKLGMGEFVFPSNYFICIR